MPSQLCANSPRTAAREAAQRAAAQREQDEADAEAAAEVTAATAAAAAEEARLVAEAAAAEAAAADAAAAEAAAAEPTPCAPPAPSPEKTGASATRRSRTESTPLGTISGLGLRARPLQDLSNQITPSPLGAHTGAHSKTPGGKGHTASTPAPAYSNSGDGADKENSPSSAEHHVPGEKGGGSSSTALGIGPPRRSARSPWSVPTTEPRRSFVQRQHRLSNVSRVGDAPPRRRDGPGEGMMMGEDALLCEELLPEGGGLASPRAEDTDGGGMDWPDRQQMGAVSQILQSLYSSPQQPGGARGKQHAGEQAGPGDSALGGPHRWGSSAASGDGDGGDGSQRLWTLDGQTDSRTPSAALPTRKRPVGGPEAQTALRGSPVPLSPAHISAELHTMAALQQTSKFPRSHHSCPESSSSMWGSDDAALQPQPPSQERHAKRVRSVSGGAQAPDHCLDLGPIEQEDGGDGDATRLPPPVSATMLYGMLVPQVAVSVAGRLHAAASRIVPRLAGLLGGGRLRAAAAGEAASAAAASPAQAPLSGSAASHSLQLGEGSTSSGGLGSVLCNALAAAAASPADGPMDRPILFKPLTLTDLTDAVEVPVSLLVKEGLLPLGAQVGGRLQALAMDARSNQFYVHFDLVGAFHRPRLGAGQVLSRASVHVFALSSAGDAHMPCHQSASCCSFALADAPMAQLPGSIVPTVPVCL